MPQGDAVADSPDRGPISVRGWKVFGPGFHKGQLYSPADCQQIAANYRRLLGKITPTVKLGHDREQRLKASTGFPNLGRVTRCDCEPDGTIVLDLSGVPPEIAGKINSGQINSGSIELKANAPDPADPAKKLPGDVLTAVALLGEEQPAVPGFAPPRAVYADGTEVEPDHSAAEWLTAMADVVRQMAAESRADPVGERVICFSDMFQEPPVTIDDVIAFLATASPEDKAKADAACGDASVAPPPTDTAMADSPKEPEAKPADDGKPPAWFTAFSDDVSKRLGGLEAANTAMMSADADKEEKQFSAEVARVVDAAVRAGHVQPWQKADMVIAGMSKDRTKVFADGPAKGRTEFAAWAAALEAGKTSTFSDRIEDGPKPGDVQITPGGRRVLDAIKITNPRVHERLNAG